MLPSKKIKYTPIGTVACSSVMIEKLSYTGGFPRTALAIKETTRRTRNMKNRICAIPADAPAIPVKPKSPAITARIKKVRAQDSIIIFG